MNKLTIYTDGSFDRNKPEYTYGAFYCEGLDINEVFKTKVPEATSLWNVGGELLAAACAITFAAKIAETLEQSNESLEVNLYYDYEGVGKWAKREWKARKPLTQGYRDFVRAKMNTHPNMKINFIWIMGHKGIDGNEVANDLAISGLRGMREAKLMDELIEQVLGR